MDQATRRSDLRFPISGFKLQESFNFEISDFTIPRLPFRFISHYLLRLRFLRVFLPVVIFDWRDIHFDRRIPHRLIKLCVLIRVDPPELGNARPERAVVLSDLGKSSRRHSKFIPVREPLAGGYQSMT